MSVPPDVLVVVRQWVERAENGLTTAEHTLTLGDRCPFDTVCFHAQQCVEKYLKAFLTLRGIDFPRTHDLTELLALALRDTDLGIAPRDAQALTPYAVIARYPGDWGMQNRDEAERAVDIARRVRRILTENLPLDAEQAC
jgi:HEPN domain-containing protein